MQIPRSANSNFVSSATGQPHPLTARPDCNPIKIGFVEWGIGWGSSSVLISRRAQGGVDGRSPPADLPVSPTSSRTAGEVDVNLDRIARKRDHQEQELRDLEEALAVWVECQDRTMPPRPSC
jgi:hypothetical protein